MDLKDSISNLSDVLTGFRPVHVGLQYGTHYLSIPDGEKSSWRDMDCAYRVISRYVDYVFDVDLPEHDPFLFSMLGEGWTVDSKFRLFATEWMHYGSDWGFWNYKPNRVSCVGVVSMMLRTVGIPLTATTSYKMFKELRELERIGIYRIKLNEELSKHPT